MTVTLATFMEVLDSSIANVALPHIAGGLGATQDEATWVLTAYLVANAVILPAGAYMTTFIGRKKFYMICVALFGISSALCGLAPTLPLLVFCRVLQGIGGGGLAPSEQAILADTFPPEKRGQAFAMYGLAVVCAPAIGPTLGGYITDNFDWRWIFFINVPVAIFSLEMSQESLLTRMLCAAARVDSQRFRAGYLNEQERQKLRAAANQMVEAPLFIDDTAGANLMDMHAKLRKLKQQQGGLGLVVVDYLQLMSIRGRTENRNQEVSQLSRGMKLMSKELGCPFLVLSQLSRDGNAAGRPQAPAERSARIGIDRAGRRSGRFHFPAGSLPARSRRSQGPRGTDSRQAAQRPDREDRSGVSARADQIRESG